MSDQFLTLNDKVYQYILDVSLREPELFQQLRDETSKLSSSVMQISPDQGQFMAFLAKLINAKRAIEIGVYTGYSAMVVANALPDDGELIACDINEEWTTLAKTYWEKAGLSHKIKLKIAPANETLDQLIQDGEENKFDFAFIDADKTGYDQYYEKCLKLIRPGGLIVIDNILQGNRVVDESNQDKATIALRELNKKLLIDERVDISLLPVRDGLTLARKI